MPPKKKTMKKEHGDHAFVSAGLKRIMRSTDVGSLKKGESTSKISKDAVLLIQKYADEMCKSLAKTYRVLVDHQRKHTLNLDTMTEGLMKHGIKFYTSKTKYEIWKKPLTSQQIKENHKYIFNSASGFKNFIKFHAEGLTPLRIPALVSMELQFAIEHHLKQIFATVTDLAIVVSKKRVVSVNHMRYVLAHACSSPVEREEREYYETEKHKFATTKKPKTKKKTTKSKAKPKSPAKSPTKPKSKPKTQAKPKSPAKSPTKPKAKPKTQAKPKTKSQTKPKAKK